MKYMGRLGTKLVRNAAEDVTRKGAHRGGKSDTLPQAESASELDGFDSDGAPEPADACWQLRSTHARIGGRSPACRG